MKKILYKKKNHYQALLFLEQIENGWKIQVTSPENAKILAEFLSKKPLELTLLYPPDMYERNTISHFDNLKGKEMLVLTMSSSIMNKRTLYFIIYNEISPKPVVLLDTVVIRSLKKYYEENSI